MALDPSQRPPLKPGETNEPVYFPEERDGWHGYIEWEKYPEKKAEAARILSKYQFLAV